MIWRIYDNKNIFDEYICVYTTQNENNWEKHKNAQVAKERRGRKAFKPVKVVGTTKKSHEF